jgi:hypothetical protein
MDCNMWFFCFSDNATNRFAQMCRRGFRHVSAFSMLPNGFVLAVDPLAFGVSAQLSNEITVYQIVDKMKEKGHRVIALPVVPKKGFIRRGMPLTCASYLAYTAGIPFMGFTPYQLFKRIKRIGGVEV